MKYIIIGNGVAGTTAAANIRKLDSEGRITIIGEEPYPFYSRIRLIDFLAGDVDEKGLVLKKDDWYAEQRIELILNTKATAIDAGGKEITVSSGEKMKFDRLLIATGSLCFVPQLPGADKEGVFTLRTLDDAIRIREYAKKNRRLTLIGGGVLGLEAGNALRKTGSIVSVVEFFPRLLPRQTDPECSAILKAQMEAMGFTFYLGAKSKEIAGGGKAEALMLEDGRKIDCDIIIISAGVRPDAACAQGLDIKLSKGIVVDDRMATSIPDIYAAGDVAEHRGAIYGIWPASEKQGEIAGINMAGGTALYEGTVMSNRLKVAGIDLAAAGDIDPEGKRECIVKKDAGSFVYKKLVLSENRIIGAVLLGDIGGWMKVVRAIDDERDISGIRKELDGWRLEVL